MKLQPPRLANRLLRAFLRDYLLEEVEGDLLEKFEGRVKSMSLLRAKLNYWFEVFHYMRPFAMRKSISPFRSQNAMFRNFVVVGWRNLSRQKTYSAIKIGGFAAGIAACFLIVVFVRSELTYDRGYPNGDRIYRLVRTTTFRGETSNGVHFPAPFAAALRNDFPEIEKVGRLNQTEFFGAGENEVRRTDRTESVHEDGFVYMDQSLVDMLSLPFLAGNPQKALDKPNTIVITQRMATKHFLGENPIDKVLLLNNDEKKQYTITGVVADPPATTHLQYNFIMTLSGYEFSPGEQTNWMNANYPIYLLLTPRTDVARFEQRLSMVIDKYFLPGHMQSSNGQQADVIAWVKSMQFKLQPIDEIYLNGLDIHDGTPHGDVRYIGLFAAIAGFILLIACINFINLSTARSANRAREVGLRKVVGSLRTSLIAQFLTESVLFSLLSFALGIILAVLLLPYFGSLVAKPLSFSWKEWELFPLMAAFAVIIGVGAGLYPAFYLSSFRPAQVLKGKVSQGSKSSSLRSVLVVFQFTISIILIIGTLIIGRQMDFVLAKKVGYDKDQVVILEGTHTMGNGITTFKDELLRLPGVREASISGYLPVEGTKRNNNGFYAEGRKGIDQAVSSQRWSVDHDYVKTLGLKIIDGRDFSIDLPSDSNGLIINRSMAKALNLDQPVGKRIGNGWSTWTVIGVIEDFHFESMKKLIGPLCLNIERSPQAIAVKLDTRDIPGAMRSITRAWKNFLPNQAIRYSFLDESYSRMYDDVRRMGDAFRSFAFLAILVACLGLFALSSFMVEQRNREISIRLVLGASVNSIFRLLNSNFIFLVGTSLVIAIPAAFYLMKEWLKDFAYKTDITWDLFLVTGLLTMSIALVTVSFQSIRAALANPVEGLRSE